MRMMAMAFPFENLDFGRLWWMTEGTSILHQVQALNDICAFLWQRICQNQVLYLLQVQYVLSFLAQERASADLLVPHWETKSSRGTLRMGVAPPLSCSLTSTRCGRRDFTHHLKTHFFRTHNLGRIWIQFWNKPACWCSVVLSSTWSEFSDLGTTVKHVVDLEPGFFLSDKVIVRRVNACNPVHTSTWLSIVPSIGPQCMISGDPSGRSVPSLPVPVYTWHRTLTVTKGFTRMRPRDPSRSSDGPFG